MYLRASIAVFISVYHLLNYIDVFNFLSSYLREQAKQTNAKKEGHRNKNVHTKNLVRVRSEDSRSLLDVALIHLWCGTSRGEK